VRTPIATLMPPAPREFGPGSRARRTAEATRRITGALLISTLLAEPPDSVPFLPPKEHKRQFPWRSASVGAWIVALAAVAIVYGTRRRDALLERRVVEVLNGIERSHEALAGVMSEAPRGALAFEPLPGTSSTIVSPSGDEFARLAPSAWEQIQRGASRARELSNGDWYVARPLHGDLLITHLPFAALEERLAPERDELTFVLWGSAAALLVTAVTMAVVVRRRLWDFRARATAQYVVAIRREGAKWKALTESAADMIFIVDPRDGRTIERNRMVQATLGEATLEKCLSPEDYGELLRGLRAAGEAPGVPVALRELVMRAADGRELRVDVRLADIDLGPSRVVEISMRDVTRERAMERQLSISERLTSLGLLTAGVAHEINNPLEGIANYLTLLEKSELPLERRARYIEQVRVGFDRIRDIVRDLLAFARPGVEHGETDLRQVVERVRKLVGYTKAFEHIEVDVVGLDEALVVPGDRGRIEQVLLNLFLNAATAMGGRGRIALEAQRIPRGFAGEPTVRLIVDDQGPGIAPADLSRIFDPFFTTTQGNGLGLSISYGIVQAHGGALSASNRPGGGARFVVELPSTRDKNPAA
jgi:signal transduction histidine kinase